MQNALKRKKSKVEMLEELKLDITKSSLFSTTSPPSTEGECFTPPSSPAITE